MVHTAVALVNNKQILLSTLFDTLFRTVFFPVHHLFWTITLSFSPCSFCGSRELKGMWLWNCAYQLTAEHREWCMHQLEDNSLLCRARCFFRRALVEMAAASSHPLHSEQQDSTHSDKIQFLNATRVCLIQISVLSFFAELSENRGFSFTNLHNITK